MQWFYYKISPVEYAPTLEATAASDEVMELPAGDDIILLMFN